MCREGLPDGLCDALGYVSMRQQLHGVVINGHNGATLIDIVVQLLD